MFLPFNHFARTQKKLNRTQQQRICTNKLEDTITQNKHINLSQIWSCCTRSGLERDWAYSYRSQACMEHKDWL